MIQKKLLLIGILLLVPGAVSAMKTVMMELPKLGKCTIQQCGFTVIKGTEVISCLGRDNNGHHITVMLSAKRFDEFRYAEDEIEIDDAHWNYLLKSYAKDFLALSRGRQSEIIDGLNKLRDVLKYNQIDYPN